MGIKGLTFDSASFTLGSSEKCSNLHGHTYIVDVELEGVPDESTGMVMDFLELKRKAREIIEEYDHVVLMPKRYEGSVSLEGPFRGKIKYIDKPHDTAELLALEIAERLYRVFQTRVRVTLYEGFDKYVTVELP